MIIFDTLLQYKPCSSETSYSIVNEGSSASAINFFLDSVWIGFLLFILSDYLHQIQSIR